MGARWPYAAPLAAPIVACATMSTLDSTPPMPSPSQPSRGSNGYDASTEVASCPPSYDAVGVFCSNERQRCQYPEGTCLCVNGGWDWGMVRAGWACEPTLTRNDGCPALPPHEPQGCSLLPPHGSSKAACTYYPTPEGPVTWACGCQAAKRGCDGWGQPAPCNQFWQYWCPLTEESEAASRARENIGPEGR
jgi:hypothetical protein